MDLDTLRNAARERIGVTSADALYGDAAMARLVNAALHRIETREPNGWPWLLGEDTFSISAGTERYSFATVGAALTGTPTIAKINGAWLVQGGLDNEMLRMHHDELRRRYPSTTTGRPESYAVHGNDLVFGPSPDDTYDVVLQFLRAEPDLSAGGDTPVMPAIYHDSIVEQAAYLAYRRAQDEVGARGAKAELDEWLRQMRGHSRPYRGAGRVARVGRQGVGDPYVP